MSKSESVRRFFLKNPAAFFNQDDLAIAKKFQCSRPLVQRIRAELRLPALKRLDKVIGRFLFGMTAIETDYITAIGNPDSPTEEQFRQWMQQAIKCITEDVAGFANRISDAYRQRRATNPATEIIIILRK